MTNRMAESIFGELAGIRLRLAHLERLLEGRRSAPPSAPAPTPPPRPKTCKRAAKH